MCFAILEVKYRTSTTQNETIKVDDEEALNTRLAALYKNDQVAQIKVFTLHQTHHQKLLWSTAP